MERAYKFLIAGLAIGLVVAAAGTFALTSGTSKPQLDCNECHAGGHGSVIAPDVNMNGTILLTGDTPLDEYVVVGDIFKLPEVEIGTIKSQTVDGEGVPSHGVPLLGFLRAHGVDDFSQVVVYADDFIITMDKSDITGETIIIPMEYSIRILGSNMPVNMWAKNTRSVVVIGGNAGDSVSINGKGVSFGQMLDNGLQSASYSRKPTIYTTLDNEEYTFDSGFMAYGISLKGLLLKEGYTDFSNVTLTGPGLEKTYSRSEVLGGDLFVTRSDGKIVVAIPDKNRQNWMDVESITVS
jgi:hypothetical protein